MTELREVMSARQLSVYLGFSYETLRQILLNDEDSLPPYTTIGGHRRWYLPTVRTWFENNTGSGSLQGKSTKTIIGQA